MAREAAVAQGTDQRPVGDPPVETKEAEEAGDHVKESSPAQGNSVSDHVRVKRVAVEDCTRNLDPDLE